MNRVPVIVVFVGLVMAGVATALWWLLGPGAQDRIDALIPWVICAQQRDRDRAIRACTIVIVRGDRENLVDRVAAFYNRGVAYGEKGQVDRALMDYSEAIRLDPEHDAAFLNRAIVHVEKNEMTLAISDLDRAIELKPDDSLAHRDRGLIRSQLNDEAGALADYGDAIRAQPSFALPFLDRALLYERRKDFGRALADISKYRELRPSDPEGTKAEARMKRQVQHF